jgi:hypothetical protein
MTMDTTIRTGDVVVIFYDADSLPGTVSKIVKSRTGNVRRIGITPDGADIVVWFTPVPKMFDGTYLTSVGGSTVAYW